MVVDALGPLHLVLAQGSSCFLISCSKFQVMKHEIKKQPEPGIEQSRLEAELQAEFEREEYRRWGAYMEAERRGES